MKRVLVAMSGGVDSSVAAFLLKQQGYDCIGVTMKLYENETVGRRVGTCCSLDDIEDARAVAERIGIPYHVFNFTADFEGQVIRRFVEGYEAGDTPNPCIDCNRYLKFARLMERARQLGCDFVATGHYARIGQEDGLYTLRAGLDAQKDQSYVLYAMTQAQLAHTLLPLGELPKSEVRAIAARQGFCNAHKHDSQDICFVPDGDYAAFLERLRGGAYPHGNFVDAAGHVLGEHKGYVHYTLGQRKGLGISAAAPLYVTAKNPAANTVTLGDNAALFSTVFFVGGVNWLDGTAPQMPMRLAVCPRYHAKKYAALVAPARPAGVVRVMLDTPARAITPGQAAVFYEGDRVVGGGVICAAPQK
ncbi:MAG: tRNA 2-thiouridine(34) synthase MnmA [Faecalibacterium sp.]|jgi:tRNA-specific 2-thiouridylase|nr:tRNA 2-thiouridine(34) synthase MnmA [Faecalibacterium sp.]